jgi:hypothetical protein
MSQIMGARPAARHILGDLQRLNGRGIASHKVLKDACRLGAYVASHYGAAPLLPSELKKL